MQRRSLIPLLLVGAVYPSERAPLLAAETLAVPGTVEISSPAAGRFFRHGDPIVFYANPDETARDISKVTYLIDGREAGTATVPPFRCEIPAPAPGRHKAVARAEMADGRTEQSVPVPFRITRSFDQLHPNATYRTLPTDKPQPKVVRPKKAAKPAGSAQRLLVGDVINPPYAPNHNFAAGPYEILTSDRHPPKGQTLRVSAEDGVIDEDQMRWLRVHRWVPKTERWVPVTSAIDESKLVVSAPITAEGIYCLAELDTHPMPAVSVRWLAPAEGAVVRGKTLVAIALTGTPMMEPQYFVQRLFNGQPAGPALELNEVVPLGYVTTPSPPEPVHDLQNAENERTFDARSVASGAYCLTVVVHGAKGLDIRARRTLRVESDIKLPSVTIDSITCSNDDGSEVLVTGTVTKGTLYMRGVKLYADGAEVGNAEIEEPSTPNFTSVRWTCRLTRQGSENDLPLTARMLTAAAIDEASNQSVAASGKVPPMPSRAGG